MSFTKPTVLVVDDIPDNIKLIHGILSEQYIVRAATSGVKALELVRVEPLPSLILLDVMMPNLDGFQTCCRLKLDPITKDIPVIFVTAKTDTIDEKTGLELGGVDYITKPINADILKLRIKNHVRLI